LLIVLLVVAALATVWMVYLEIAFRRASYQGKSVPEWALALHASYEPRGTNAPAVAFRAMGTEAVPTLRSLLKLRDPAYEKVFLKHARRLPAKLRLYLFKKINPGRAIEYRLGAIRALGVIGPAAVPALPDLVRILAEPDGRIRWTVAQTLPLLGPEAVDALIPALTNADVNLRHAAVYALGEARTNALPTVPALVRCTLDTNESVRASAIYSLGRVGMSAMPRVLEIAATEPDPQLQNAAFRSLVVLRPPPGRVIGSHQMITTNSPEIRRMALLSLWFSRQTNAHALKLYRAGRDDEDPSVRELAEKILNRLNSTNRTRLVPL
jgi:hypothetical protein